MRTTRWPLALVLLLPLLAPAQSPSASSEAHPIATALDSGPLIVWLVAPGTAADRARILLQKQAVAPRNPATSEERTLADFGTSSSNVGQTSGSYGQPASTLGKAASDTGQNASTYGTAASNVGSAASDVGQTAGSYGQTAGSYGQSASSIGESSATLNSPVRSPGPGSGALRPTAAPARNPARDTFLGEIHGPFANLDIKLVDIVAEELKDKLAAVNGSPDYPDILIARTLPSWWQSSNLGVAMLGLPSFLDAVDTAEIGGSWRLRPATILRQAPHPQRARAFVVWLRDRQGCTLCELTDLDSTVDAPAKIAANALRRVLSGDALGTTADTDAAQFNAGLAQSLAWTPPSPQSLDALELRVDITEARANARFAVISLRAIASSPVSFGVAHAIVVLRKNAAGVWKVLQVSPNVPLSRTGVITAQAMIEPFAEDATPTEKVVGISQASPPDGDSRSPQPDLWWDNGGGSGLLVVEWQKKVGISTPAWSDTRMMPVTDTNPRVQTRVPATFAATAGEYRWRVWAIGKGGIVVLSPWRRLNIVQ